MHLYSDDQNLDLDKFLSYTKPSPDLRNLILGYVPLQTPLAYAKEFYPCAILDSIRKMVGVNVYTRLILHTPFLGLRR